MYLKLICREENKDAETQTKTPPTALGFLHMGSYILFELDSHVSCWFSPRHIQDHTAYTADLILR